MAYYRRNYRRRYRRRRYRKKRGGNDYISTAMKALSLAKYLKTLVNVERKYVDVQGTTSIGTTWSAILLNGVAEGDGENARDGNTIKAMSNLNRLQLKINGSATYSRVRVMLVRYKPSHGSTSPVVAQLFQDTADILSPLNKDYIGDYKIYFDKIYTMSVNNDSANIQLNKFMKGLKFHTRYSGTSNASTSLSMNSLWLCLVSDEATNTPTYDLYNRFNYVDN